MQIWSQRSGQGLVHSQCSPTACKPGFRTCSTKLLARHLKVPAMGTQHRLCSPHPFSCVPLQLFSANQFQKVGQRLQSCQRDCIIFYKERLRPGAVQHGKEQPEKGSSQYLKGKSQEDEARLCNFPSLLCQSFSA